MEHQQAAEAATIPDFTAATCHGYGVSQAERLSLAAISDLIAPINTDRDEWHGRTATRHTTSEQELGSARVMVAYELSDDLAEAARDIRAADVTILSVAIKGEDVPARVFVPDMLLYWSTCIAAELNAEAWTAAEDRAQDEAWRAAA